MTKHPAPHDWPLDAFDFDLPDGCIADHPVEPRDHAKMMHVEGAEISDHHIYDLADLLRADDVLVMNNTKVIPARLYGFRDTVKVEVMLNKEERTKDQSGITWSALARPGKRLKVGQTIIFADGFEAEITDKLEGGEIHIRFDTSRTDFLAKLHKHGHIPLPPYIKRQQGNTAEDRTRYQTVYAAHEGAVAAPTAGLHFTPELFQKLRDKGITCKEVTLHVGAGTFLPVKTDRVADHIMHAEWGEIDKATADYLTKAKHDGRRIIAVGTTSLRLLESTTDENGVIHPFSGETDIFITPGYTFRAIDAMLTNFHLPKSTLFMLVSALAGLDNMRSAYAHAIKNNYRFYSYGDATLLEKREEK